jgi:hypothetical protein
MLEWLAKNWGWVLAGIVFAGYFAFYVLAMREQRTAPNGRSQLPCDRC